MVSIDTVTCGIACDGSAIEAAVISMDSSGTFLHIHAGMHGDEPEGRDVAVFLLDEIRCDKLIPGSNLVVVPQINPTGLRKGLRVTDTGTDLNRNFPTRTWIVDHSQQKYFPGSGPASEPETQAVIAIMESYPPHAVVTLHTWVRQVNFDGDERAARLAEFLAKLNGYPVTPYIGYPTPGSFGTYAGIEKGIPTVTLEMPENSGLDTCLEENGQALRELVKWGGLASGHYGR